MSPVKLSAVWWSLERLLLTVWVGGMLAVGYVVAPVLFSTLDRALAGAVAGRVFGWMSLIGLVCGGLLILIWVVRDGRAAARGGRLWVVCAMLVITSLGEFGLAPRMQEMKLAAGAVLQPGSGFYRQFARLHGLASALFVLNSLLGLVLVLAPPAGRSGFNPVAD